WVHQVQFVFGSPLSLPPLKESSQALPQFAGSWTRYVTGGPFLGTPVSNKRPPTPLPLVVSDQSVSGLGLALARRLPSISNPPGSPFCAFPAPTTSANCVQAVTAACFAVKVKTTPTSWYCPTDSELEIV